MTNDDSDIIYHTGDKGDYKKFDVSIAKTVYTDHDIDNNLHMKSNFDPYVFIKPEDGKKYFLPTLQKKSQPYGYLIAETYPVGVFLVEKKSNNGAIPGTIEYTVKNTFTANKVESKEPEISVAYKQDELEGGFTISTKFDTAKMATSSTSYTYVQDIPSVPVFAYSSVLVMVEILYDGQKGNNMFSYNNNNYNFYALNRNDITLHRDQCAYSLVTDTDHFYEILKNNPKKWVI